MSRLGKKREVVGRAKVRVRVRVRGMDTSQTDSTGCPEGSQESSKLTAPPQNIHV